MRGEEPSGIRFNTLKRPNVGIEIDVPAGSVSVFLALIARRHRIKIRFRPETLRQCREAEAGAKLFGCLDDPFRIASFKILVDVGGLNESFPFLRPAVVDPVSRYLFRNRLMIFLSQ